MTKNLQIGKLCPEQAVLVALGAGDPTPRELTRSLVSLRFFRTAVGTQAKKNCERSFHFIFRRTRFRPPIFRSFSSALQLKR